MLTLNTQRLERIVRHLDAQRTDGTHRPLPGFIKLFSLRSEIITTNTKGNLSPHLVVLLALIALLTITSTPVR